MRSIRKRLVLWLLLGLAALWAAAGAGLYYTVRQSELTRLDVQLDKMENPARFYLAHSIREANTPPHLRRQNQERGGRTDGEERGDQRPRRSYRRWLDMFDEDGTSYFQAWDNKRTSRHKSASLGEHDFDYPADLAAGSPRYFDVKLPDGTRLRAKATHFRFPGRGRPGPGDRRPPAGDASPRGTVMLATDSEGMRQTLASLLLGIAGVGVAAAAASVTLIHLALRDGLRPLRKLGERLAEVDASSLGERFASEGLPVEIAPVCDRLNELMARLETSFERERQFSADLAHELRTPVAELRAMAEVALRWPEGADREGAEATLEIAEQMGGIIESLLTLGRYESGQAEVEPQRIGLADFATASWKPFADKAAERDIAVTFDIDPAQTVETDPEMLRLIVGNLFSNAAEYTPEGGAISVGHPNGAVLRVANTAPDLDGAAVDQLFDRFWRADGSRTGGTHCGLGLALARACSEVLSLDLSARLEPPGTLVFDLEEKGAKNV